MKLPLEFRHLNKYVFSTSLKVATASLRGHLQSAKEASDWPEFEQVLNRAIEVMSWHMAHKPEITLKKVIDMGTCSLTRSTWVIMIERSLESLHLDETFNLMLGASYHAKRTIESRELQSHRNQPT